MENLNGKRLLILGGTKIQCELISAAKKLGVVTVVTDYNEPKNSPGKLISDESYMVSCTDVGAVVELIKAKNIDGVLVGFNDMLLPFYAEICEKSGLPCYGTKESFDIFTKKSEYKKLCREFNVPTVDEYSINVDDPESSASGIRFPVLVKPSDSSGSRGITVCNDINELKSAISFANKYSADKRVLVERYLTGKEVTVFWVFQDGKHYLTAIGNRIVKNDQNAIIPLPVGYTFPALITESYIKTTCDNAKKMFEHCGVKDGMMFMQCKVEDNKCVVYDIGYRLTGSLEYKVLSRLCGYDPMNMMINFALTGSMGVDNLNDIVDPFFVGKYAFNVSILARPGKIHRITGRDEVKTVPGVIDVVTAHEEGEMITDSMVGLLSQITIRILGVADSVEETYALMKKVYDMLDIYDEEGNSMKLPGIEYNDLISDLR